MKRRLLRLAAPVAAVGLLAACGGATAANNGNNTATGSNGGNQARRGFNGAAGELVQINGSTLILNGQNGDATVVYNNGTTFVQTKTGAFSDIQPGKCITAIGPKDASGNVTASGVQLSDLVNGACPAPGNGQPFIQRSPRPGFTPNPQFANFNAVRGQVTAVSGTTVTIKDSTGASQSVTVPTTVVVSVSTPVTSSALALHECLNANGSKDSAGTVTARTVRISPLGSNGTCSTGRFGGGRFGGGGGGGGGFGGGDGAAPGSGG